MRLHNLHNFLSNVTYSILTITLDRGSIMNSAEGTDRVKLKNRV